MAASNKKRWKEGDMATWKKIPVDLWGIIFQKLAENIFDTIRFSAVCSFFRSITSSYPKHMYRLSSPFLLMPRRDSLTHDLLSMGDDDTHIYPFSLPELQYRLCVGSSYGWLITLNCDSGDIGLLNPVNRATISLPQLCRISSGISYYRKRNLKHYFKATISTDPSKDGDFTVMFLHRYYPVYLCRRGDRKWTCLKNDIISSFQDFICNMGRFYAIDYSENLVFWDHGDSKDDAAISIVKSRAIREENLLVNSPGGDLLMVHLKNGMYSRKRHKFSVFKLDKETKKFVRMRSLVKDALLLGFNPSCAICVSTVECPQYLKNCIYYTQHNQVFVYNMKGMTSKRAYKHNSSWRKPCAWVKPTFAAAINGHPQVYDAQGEH